MGENMRYAAHVLFNGSILLFVILLLTLNPTVEANATYGGSSGGSGESGTGESLSGSNLSLQKLLRIASRDLPTPNHRKTYLINNQPKSGKLADELLVSLRTDRKGTLRIIRIVSRYKTAEERRRRLLRLQKQYRKNVALLKADAERQRKQAIEAIRNDPEERNAFGAYMVWALFGGYNQVLSGLGSASLRPEMQVYEETKARLEDQEQRLKLVEVWLRNPELEIK